MASGSSHAWKRTCTTAETQAAAETAENWPQENSYFLFRYIDVFIFTFCLGVPHTCVSKKKAPKACTIKNRSREVPVRGSVVNESD